MTSLPYDWLIAQAPLYSKEVLDAAAQAIADHVDMQILKLIGTQLGAPHEQ